MTALNRASDILQFVGFAGNGQVFFAHAYVRTLPRCNPIIGENACECFCALLLSLW